MDGEVGGTLVEREFAPTSAEGGHPAIRVLQADKPASSGFDGGQIVITQLLEGEESSGSVVGIGHASGQSVQAQPPGSARV